MLTPKQLIRSLKLQQAVTRPRCTNVKRYKAIRAPKCGCQACWDKWTSRPKTPDAA